LIYVLTHDTLEQRTLDYNRTVCEVCETCHVQGWPEVRATEKRPVRGRYCDGKTATQQCVRVLTGITGGLL